MKGTQQYGVPDRENPDWTAADLAARRPFGAVFPDLAAQIVKRRARGPQVRPTKKMVSLRLDRDVLDKWRASGPGWQGRVNQLLGVHAPRPRRTKRTTKRRARP